MNPRVTAGRLLLLLTLAAPAAAQQRQITGTVVGPENQPLTLARVVVLGTGTTVGTDEQGVFRVAAPTGEVQLRIENLGYRSVTMTVGAGQNDVRIQMETDVFNLEGIVVTGQATSVSRRNLANAVGSVTPAMIESAPPAQSIEKVMQGQVAGAYIEQNSGAPGGGIQVRLRGVSTLIGESEPLYVVDGIMVSNVAIASNINEVSAAAGGSNPALTQDNLVNRIADLNPEDIERIEILKGASAAALYGSRAANGVILITTKRGRPGAPRVTLTQRLGFYDLSKKFGFREWTLDEAADAFRADDVASFFGSDGQPLVKQDMEELLAGRNDLSWETLATISGGNDDTRYFLSGTWREDEGVIDNTFYDKQSLRGNLDQRIGDDLQITANANVIHSVSDRGLTNNDNSGTSYYMVFPFTPSFVPLTRGADGTYPSNPFERSNPVQTAALMSNEEEVWRAIAGMRATWDVHEAGDHSLQLMGTLGVDFFQQKNDLFFPPELQFEDDDGLPGTSLLSNSDNTDITVSGHAVYGFADPDRGIISTATAGVQFEDRELNTARISSFGLTAGQPTLDAGVVTNIREIRQRIKDLGVFAQEELLMLDERLLLTAGIRADRSSVNAETDRFFVYPKASASYRFDFPATGIDALKVRAAWGQSGNQPLYGQKFTPLTATSNIGGLPGLIVQGTVAAEDLQPEQQTEIEAGFDLTLLEGRAQFEATAFQKTITDMLLQRTPAPSTGFATEIFNGGELRVRGLELALLATPYAVGDFSWTSSTTFYRDDSQVTDLPVPAFEVGGFGTGLGAFRIEEGASATQIVGTIDDEGTVARIGDATP
ncbi:MAG TPA: SusC/RagA family TonB-linked outer membrane protein, partial [Longimicrobiales bacterium]|nr:SusC/RagA family TonB-linked outer membrane protein [Longimicrobiales bacterium]